MQDEARNNIDGDIEGDIDDSEESDALVDDEPVAALIAASGAKRIYVHAAIHTASIKLVNEVRTQPP